MLFNTAKGTSRTLLTSEIQATDLFSTYYLFLTLIKLKINKSRFYRGYDVVDYGYV